MEPAINWNMGIIALGITIFLFVLNIIINPPYIPELIFGERKEIGIKLRKKRELE